MNWQSPKYFGYYPSSINVTSILAEMFATTFQTPSFSYAVAPSFTELENTMMDWSAKAIGLPEKFLLKNSGGGIINNSATESIFVSAHAAKFKKLKELKLEGNNPDVLKLVGYFGQGSHISSERALTVKDIYYRRAIPYVYNEKKLNYELDFDRFVEIVEEDVKAGLIPFWFGGSWGNTFSAAIDIDERVVQFCKAQGIWVNIDAAFLGSTWICEQYRPKEGILEDVDSICVNFTKLLLNGTGGSLFYIGDKKLLNESFGAKTLQFSFYKNHFSDNYDIVDYKDWIVGLARRNNSLKVYYTFLHYGLKALRESVLSQEVKARHLVEVIRSRPDLFKLHTFQYAVVLFQVRGKDGSVSLDLTKSVAAKIKNIKEGFCSPAEFQGDYVLRIVVGNFHTTEEHVSAYIGRIIEVAREEQDQGPK
jgi:glutamate/tyrosine decarboxylase-like PLP-dependent enzyme